jgi:hypothetical protein
VAHLAIWHLIAYLKLSTTVNYPVFECRSLTADPKVGDHWAAWYRFELQFGTPETQAEIVKQVRH